MRERTTWNRDEILKRAGVSKTADPYSMNQDHKQPSADAYVTGDPSTFAEDVAPNDWSSEYSGGQLKRNEIGMPEMRSDTFNHPEKTAAMDEELLVKKADLCVQVARKMLAGKKFASEKLSEAVIEDQATALMHLPDADLVNTFNRLADEAPVAAPVVTPPPAPAADPLLVQASKQLLAGQTQNAQRTIQMLIANGIKKAQEEKAQQQQQVQAQDQQQGKEQQVQAQDQQQQSQEQQVQAQDQQVAQQGLQSQQQMQAIESMIQSMVQQAMQQQGQSQQQQVAQQQQQVSQQQQAAMLQQQAQQQQQQASDDVLLEQMLSGPGVEPMSEMDIQMDAAPMDVGEIQLAAEDDVLKHLFANEETQEAESQQQQEGQQKSAFVRTASSRTVGTRPGTGVPRIGGIGGPNKGNDVDKLTALWPSAPDVRDAFK